MHVGRPPFQSPVEAQVYQKILSLDFSWPQNIEVSMEARDIVERLMKLKPS
jgi:hypothetical protein